MKNIFYLLVVLILSESCSDEVSVLTLNSDTAVVEGYIYANRPVDSIRITQSIAYSGDGSLITIDDVTPVLSDGVEEVELRSIGNGYYQNLDFIIEEDRTYSLSFNYNGRLVSGSSYVNPTKEISLSQTSLGLEKIEFTGGGPGQGGPGQGGPGGFGAVDQELVEITWDNTEFSYYFIDVENIEIEPEYVNGIFEFFEEQGIERPERFFRSEPEIVDFYTLDTRRELQFFGIYEITIYRLNAEYAALYESIGSSTLSLDEPPSNIENGLGIFTAVTPHKVLFEVTKE